MKRKHLPLASTVAVFLGLYILGSVLFRNFLSFGVFANLFTDGAALGIIAVGMTFVILSGSIDLSVGGVLALSTVLLAALLEGPQMLAERDVRDSAGLAKALREGRDALSEHLRDRLSQETLALVDSLGGSDAGRLRSVLAADLDAAVQSDVLYTAPLVAHVSLSKATKEQIEAARAKGGASPGHARRAALNHAVLRDAYPRMVTSSGAKHPCVPVPVAILIVLLVGPALGFGMGCLIRYFDLPPFIVTLAGMFLARGLALIVAAGTINISNPWFAHVAAWGPHVGGATLRLGAVMFVAVVLVGVFAAAHTVFGRNVYAIGGHAEAALLMGIPVGRTKVLVHTLSGLCASLGGLVFTLNSPAGDPNAGLGMELDAIAAVVVGGTLLSGGVGYVFGTLIGVLIFGVIGTGIRFQGSLSSSWTRVAIGALLLFFILLQRVFTRRAAPRA